MGYNVCLACTFKGKRCKLQELLKYSADLIFLQNNNFMNDINDLICTRCGSPRVQSQKIVRQSANPLYPITVTQYRCTNDACQKESDEKQAELIKERLERAEKSKRNFPHKKTVVNS